MDRAMADALHGRFLRGLATSADTVAVRVGDDAITYARAHELALLWAGALAAAGARAVGILAAKGVTGYVGALAALYAGAAVVPLRPDFPTSRTRQMIAMSGVTALVVDDKGRAALPEVLAGQKGIAVLDPGGRPGDDGFGSRLVPDPRHTLDRPRSVVPDDPAYVLFTSGSTGRAKGVVLTHGNTGNYFRRIDARWDFTSRDVFSQTADLTWDLPVFDLFAAWGAGASVVAVPAHAYRDLPRFLAESGVTVWASAPSVIDLVRRVGGLDAGAIAGLRWSIFGGEALACSDAAEWQRAAPASRIENVYGPTELTINIASHRWSDDGSPGLAVNGVVPIGRVHDDHDHILLGLDGEPAETEGELCVAGPQLCRGYLDPDDGRDRFLERDRLRWYRTGDWVRRIGHGELAYLGRRDSQVQVHGLRVELSEIEHALRECGLHDAVAVGVPTAVTTELCVFYTGAPVAVAEIVRQLRGLLPDGVIPKHYRDLSELPLNANRKVDRLRLAEQARELIPTVRHPEPLRR